VLDDYVRLHELADAAAHLEAGATTILKDNISWHFPMPAANSEPRCFAYPLVHVHARRRVLPRDAGRRLETAARPGA
jgi:hypothetical protein